MTTQYAFERTPFFVVVVVVVLPRHIAGGHHRQTGSYNLIS
jgi:hypothetical protein